MFEPYVTAARRLFELLFINIDTAILYKIKKVMKCLQDSGSLSRKLQRRA